MRTQRTTKTASSTASEVSGYTPGPNEKDEAAKALRKHGLDAANDHSVVMVTYSEPGAAKEIMKKEKEILDSVNYQGSYGARFGKSQAFDRTAASDEDDFSPTDEDFYQEDD